MFLTNITFKGSHSTPFAMSNFSFRDNLFSAHQQINIPMEKKKQKANFSSSNLNIILFRLQVPFGFHRLVSH